jgi:hypothetical protein
MTTKTSNYTEEQTEQLHELYAELGNDGFDQICETLGKTRASVRAKLVKDGLYVAPEKQPNRKDGPTKKELIREIHQMGHEVDGLEGATKEAISWVVELLKKPQAQNN